MKLKMCYWTLSITAQSIGEAAGVTVSQNEWTLSIASQAISESAGVTVSQNEWTLGIATKNKKKYIFVVQRVIDRTTRPTQDKPTSLSSPLPPSIKLSNELEFFLQYQRIKNQRRPKK